MMSYISQNFPKLSYSFSDNLQNSSQIRNPNALQHTIKYSNQDCLPYLLVPQRFPYQVQQRAQILIFRSAHQIHESFNDLWLKLVIEGGQPLLRDLKC